MSDVATVHLTVPIAPPDGRKEHRGYIFRHDERGVWITDREDGRGACTFYPVDRIARIEFNTGWR